MECVDAIHVTYSRANNVIFSFYSKQDESNCCLDILINKMRLNNVALPHPLPIIGHTKNGRKQIPPDKKSFK